METGVGHHRWLVSHGAIGYPVHQVMDLHGGNVGLMVPVSIEQTNCRAQLVLLALDLVDR